MEFNFEKIFTNEELAIEREKYRLIRIKDRNERLLPKKICKIIETFTYYILNKKNRRGYTACNIELSVSASSSYYPAPFPDILPDTLNDDDYDDSVSKPPKINIYRTEDIGCIVCAFKAKFPQMKIEYKRSANYEYLQLNWASEATVS